jgi:hypothetical protein
MGHNIEQGEGGGDCRLLKFQGFVASVPRLLKLIVVYNLWLFYIVQLHSIFQAEFFGGIFVFLLQILAEFFDIWN